MKIALCAILICIAMAAVPQAAAGETVAAKPAAYLPDSSTVTVSDSNNAPFEQQPLAFPNDSRRGNRNASRGFSLPSLFPVFFTVAIICGLFIAALYFIKKYVPGHRQLFSHPAMEILGRTHLDQRRYVSLLRIGKRIVVIGVSPDEIQTLSEITDEAEITGILEVARPKTEQGLTLFQRLFQHHVIDQDVRQHEAMAKVEAEELADQMASLRERVRAIRTTEESRNHVDAIG